MPVQPAALQVQEFFRHAQTRESWPWCHWNVHPIVRRAINRRISGSPQRSVQQTLREVLPQLGLTLPVGQALSLGCGCGAQDRALYRHGIVTHLLGYDLSPESVASAQKWARSSGIETFRYEEGNLDDLVLPPQKYDLILAEMSLHHVTQLERLMESVAHSLRPGGLLLVDEYVGPTRFRWSLAQMEVVNRLLESLPREKRMSPASVYKPEIEHQPEEFFENTDPSEAIRSGEVLACLANRFEVLWKRDYGGTVLHPLLHDIAWNFAEGNLEDEDFLKLAIETEDCLMEKGELASDFTVLVASPR